MSKAHRQIQEEVDKLAQQYLDRIQAAHLRQQADLQQQIDECERQRELCHKRLLGLGKVRT